MKEKDCYNKEKVFEEKIAPIIRELKMACNIAKMPMFVTVAVANNENETKYENDMILSSADIQLRDNKIGQLLLLINQFDVEYPLRIQRCIKELENYLEHLIIEGQKGDKLDITLASDYIREMFGVVVSDNKVVPPKELVEKAIEEDFYEE